MFLDDLFRCSFETLSIQDKLNVIKIDRPAPDISLRMKMKNYTRHFKKDYYKSVKWLTACQFKKKLFCCPCTLFETEKGVWNDIGFSDINNFRKAKFCHEKTQESSSITKLKTFGRTRIVSPSVPKTQKFTRVQHSVTYSYKNTA